MKYFQVTHLWACVLTLFLLHSRGVSAQKADFNFTAVPASLCAPAVITIQNTSTGNPVAYDWDFGDGRTSHDVHPQITYTSGGPKKITLTAQYDRGSSTYYRTFTVGAIPAVAFTADVTNSCRLFTANFTDATPGATSRTWDFGDGTAPVVTSNAYISHAYTKAGKFDVTLTVTNTNGCTATIKKQAYIHVSLPEITLSTPVSGCVPYIAAFTAAVTNDGNDPVTTWNWTFGDGSTQSTTTGNTTHNYTQTGTYPVGILATTAGGCTVNKTFIRQVHTGNPPTNVSFTVSPQSACVGEPVRLLANANHADTYSWDFGDGQTETSNTNDIKHAFKANGNLTIQLKAGSNGCYTQAAPATIAITGPVSQFTVQRDCADKSKFIFTNTSVGTSPNTTYEWDFGDNTPLEHTQHATHQYTTPANYTVRLTIGENGGNCSHSSYQTVYHFKADFSTGVSAICRGSKATYEVLNVPLALVSNYTWQLGDGTTYTTTDQFYVKTWLTTGTFDDQLTIHYKDPAYCDDVVHKPANIKILAPQAAFSTGAVTCASQPVSFINNTQPSPNIPITNWYWELGNGQTSVLQTPAAGKYSTSGTYTVKLVVTDARNCKDSVQQDISIHPTPYVRITTQQKKICEGNSITLNVLSDGTIKWLDTDNLSCTTCADPVANPVVNTRYRIRTTNVNGCTTMDSIDITVVPKVNLTISKDTMVCYGSSVKLQAGGATFYDWTPVTGLTNNTIADPITTPSVDMVYQVTGTNDPACPMSAPLSVKVSVKPLPSVNAGKDQTVMVGDMVRLMASGSPDVVKWEWSPRDYLDNTTEPFTNALVRKPITYSITGTNQYGCKAHDLMKVDLVCNTDVVFVPNTFSPNGDGQNDIFYPRGKGISFIKSFRIFNRWGQEVFRRERINIDDINAGWNGSYKGNPQPADVYIYFIEAYCDTNEFFQLKGNVTLLR
ncbi:PKD domain-containing protein [Chitinophaga nivalis]|uniref:PKD domain-containing protein n=1 Tax=Chitinophaga nivalis TaxID=2991709 RepID=A0ABT3ISK9_9BACT|nr:PKD domain-containing protein [Chitinophaga nivalis]MCW3463366.1 PKD domain-containing protein [Chitinophaga nivalis]MCW3486944.1 PKD domain-containing protein [Chitinophaga nivalis]